MKKFFNTKNIKEKNSNIEDLSKYDNHFDNEISEIERLRNIKTINPLKKIQINRDISRVEKKIERVKKELEYKKRLKISLILFAFLGIGSILMIAIGAYYENVQKIVFINKEDSVYVGETIDLQYQVRPSTAEYDSNDISIMFENSELLEINNNNYKAVKEGNIKVSIVYKDNTYDQKTINIIPVEVESISAQDLDLGINLEKSINVQFYPENCTHKQYSLSSSDTNIVKTVDNKIVGVGEGNAKVTVKSVDGPETSFNVMVSYVEPQFIKIGGLFSEYVTGTEGKLTVLYTPKEISNSSPEISWSSSNNGVVSIDENGHINCLRRGSSVITARYSDEIFASETINVVYPDPTKITISGNSDELYKGYTMRLRASLEPELVEDNTIKWSSSDESKATVDSYGTVTGIAYGEVFITAKTVNGKEDKYKLLITEAPIVSYNDSRSSESSGGQGRIDTGGGEVYISDTSNCFHTNPTCHGMKGAWLVSIDYAKSIGLTGCYWCARGY